MNKLLFALLIIFSSCNQNAAAVDSLQWPNIKDSDEKFIANFPKNYDAFVALYGWNEEKDTAAPLYEESETHLDRFFQIVEKNPKYSTRIYEIAQNGKWQADAVNVFQAKALGYIGKHNDGFCHYLSSLKDEKKIKSIYYFLIDKPTGKPNAIELSGKCSAENKALLENTIKAYKAENSSGKAVIASDGGLKSFIPKDFEAIEKAETDYNGDGKPDAILIIAPKNEKTMSLEESEKPGKKRQLIILKNNGSGVYSLDVKNANIIPCFKCNSPADSYADFKIKSKDEFQYTKISGYNSQEELITYGFKYDKNEWHLVAVSTKERIGNATNSYELKLTKKIKLSELDLENFSTYETGKINDPDGYTNLRQEKSSKSAILEKINSGSDIKILDNSGDWWLIQDKEKTGYVHKSKISR